MISDVGDMRRRLADRKAERGKSIRTDPSSRLHPRSHNSVHLRETPSISLYRSSLLRIRVDLPAVGDFVACESIVKKKRSCAQSCVIHDITIIYGRLRSILLKLLSSLLVGFYFETDTQSHWYSRGLPGLTYAN